MSSPSSSLAFVLHFLLFFLSLASVSETLVPASAQFKLVNEGEFGPYIVEYDGSYRVLDIGTSPFQLCFYNTTPNAYTLALRMGTRRSTSLRRWVWEANRANPVRENATFSLGSDGNLVLDVGPDLDCAAQPNFSRPNVLAESDGRIAWQSNTANKGVVRFDLLPNGNMVLYDSRDNFVWQSFDSPTDTLLVGQSLRAGAVNKLVSRASDVNNVNGPYSLVLEPKGLSLYYTSKNSPKPLLYYRFSPYISSRKGYLGSVTLNCAPETDFEGFAYAYDLSLDYQVGNTTEGDGLFSARPKYNSTLTVLRLGMDGNLALYTYDDKVDWGAWEVTYSLFSGNADNFYRVSTAFSESECQLPSKCGDFGVCEDSQCVACPSPHGLLGWSKACAPPKVASCRPGDVRYYKIEGVDHFLSKFTRGDGPVKEGECGARCTKDCKCLGYFYNEETSRCWVAYELKTLTKVENSTHVGYQNVQMNEGSSLMGPISFLFF